jgi:hypothetical protein
MIDSVRRRLARVTTLNCPPTSDLSELIRQAEIAIRGEASDLVRAPDHQRLRPRLVACRPHDSASVRLCRQDVPGPGLARRQVFELDASHSATGLRHPVQPAANSYSRHGRCRIGVNRYIREVERRHDATLRSGT